MSTTASVPRGIARIGVGVTAGLVALVALPGLAHAHVTVQPGDTEGGGFSVIAFRVPNERDDASTTRLQVVLPEDQPLGSVRTTPVPGWTVRTTTRKLDQPIDLFGQRLDRVVSTVTWTAIDGGIRPGEFQDFNVNLGQLPDSGQLVFQALQTYSNGEKVSWNEVSADGTAQPEHPAPTLSISPAASTESGVNPMLSVVLSGAALVVSALAAALAWRRGRPAGRVEAGPPRDLEDARR